MMLGSVSLAKSTSGTETRGSAASSATRVFSSLSISRWIGRAQCAHSLVTVADRNCSRKRPCTKGNATASIAQAAWTLCPVLNRAACGVGSAVTG